MSWKCYRCGTTDGCVCRDGITLIHGDCMPVLASQSIGQASCILTDIPYGEVNRSSNGLRNLDKSVADNCEFDCVWLASKFNDLATGSIYVFCGSSQLSTFDKMWRTLGHTRRVLVWEKTNPMPLNGQHVWLSGIEHISYCKKESATFNGFCRNTVLRFPCGSSDRHPTEKPLDLISELLLASTNDGDVVLDPFVGSGTTLLVCKKHGRRCIGIEREERYCEIAANRLRQEVLQFTEAP